ncbi:MAG: hypothetical protein A2W52_00445 [Candidatus Taylorbacteria bacterium RIFCSPHIGHO2_02_49_25]|uniref:Uncharacterized protein n=1 Tax=Candidatus Taylorbacteria bacterium RIFCSPHIGHO2_02_49_25 TaxID=1802305 RepID=A0A1G2MGM2_9BACT|nr:MAG: hypothetical protein UY62_C0009G0020 [Parcubacteria group bacterium GW2011_GWF2_50_9]OHA20694.1 MAG: hypothetical protein A2759_03725 [Candidatus Taylorbacteria bacterium RIFCSPHIGHO2_01_FULL_49_60]OHA23065.1 MAG: hypothetical protein A2W52_00445 [Candidatus Taylorbacteria bacterium RIFCSPHIGHO2_02_49_25]OHA36401.1 MAG: hypothetical protein A2W65_02780 [Candidatus Taylorbacteria bacterium RIFCSPLOWO2_02_50_13]OHA48481.1 MAG: hypothetical protein A3G61_01635 [Candidatus Taylorbacteria ba
MTVITIPKHWARKDLVLIPREEYEALKRAQPVRTLQGAGGPVARAFKEVAMTKAQKRELNAARRDYTRGDIVTLDVLRRDLERRNSR